MAARVSLHIESDDAHRLLRTSIARLRQYQLSRISNVWRSIAADVADISNRCRCRSGEGLLGMPIGTKCPTKADLYLNTSRNVDHRGLA